MKGCFSYFRNSHNISIRNIKKLLNSNLTYGTSTFSIDPRKGINDVSVVAGGAIMGDGTVGLILDAGGIIELARQR